MRSTADKSRDVNIALLYQAGAVHDHLKQALTELGASVVYDSPAADFDHDALSRSGARVVVVNLDPGVEEEFAQLDELLADDALKVIFNDGEVSSRLEGWDQARWARHLAAKILGLEDTNPPRPHGSEAIPVKVKNRAPEYPTAPHAGLSFELEGDVLAKALSADTGEALQRTRAALITREEPIAAELVDPHARESSTPPPRGEPPTVELPRVKLEDALRASEDAGARARGDAAATHVPSSERPTLQLQAADLDAMRALQDATAFGDGGLSLVDDDAPVPAAPRAEARPVVAPDDMAFDFDLSDMDAPAAPTAASAVAADDDLSLDGDFTMASDTADEALSIDAIEEPAAPEPRRAVSSAMAPPVTAADLADEDEADAGTNELDAALRDFGFFDEPATAAPVAAATDEIDADLSADPSASFDATPGTGAIAVDDDEFGSALGAIEIEPYDEYSPTGDQRDAAPPLGLDEMLMQMQMQHRDTTKPADVAAHEGKAAATAKAAPPAKPGAPTAPAPKPGAPATPAAAKPPPLPGKAAEPARPAAAREAPAATPAAKGARAVSDFDLSHLSLSPIEGEESAPTTGRARFGVEQPEPEAAAPAPAPRNPSAPTVPPVDDDFGGLTLEAMDFDLDDTAPGPASSAARAAPPAPPAAPAARAPAPPAARAAAPAPASAAKRAAPPPVAASDDDDALSIESFDFSLDDDVAAPVQRDTGAATDDAAESELMAELAAMTAKAQVSAAPADGPIKHVWVLGASIGGPEAVREFLAAIPADAPVLFLLAQHMGADFLDLMVQQLARATQLPVRTVVSGETVAHGQVVVVPLAERLLVDRSGQVRVTAHDGMTTYSPSIDQVMRDVADRFGADAGAIVFSGMAHDAIEGAQYMHQRGGTIWVQDPATCVISSMVDGARDAGVVSLVGSPAELARQFMLRLFKNG